MKKIIETPPIWFIALTLILGAACLGVSPLFVRISEVGPASSAFWRSFLALPFILILIKSINIKTELKSDKLNYFYLALPGIFLGIDHAAWHHGIMLTSIANSTLFASMAPVFVVIYSYILFSTKITKKFFVGLIASVIGAVWILIRLVGPAVFWKSIEPIGWPVKELQLLSRKGEFASPFRNRR